jgi:hypothetical protein
MSIFATIIKKLLTIQFLVILITSTLGINASATYYTPLTQPVCSNDILVRIFSGVLYQGYNNCNYSNNNNNCTQGYYSNCNNYNKYCDPNGNVGKITNVYGDQNSTTSNNVIVTVTGKISTNCDTNPVKVFVNMTDQNGNSLINNDSQYVSINPNCVIDIFSYDCSNFTIQIQAQKSDFINKTLRVEMSFGPKNRYNYYIPFENSNLFLLEYNNNNYYYGCNLYNTCFVNYQNYPIPFGPIYEYPPFAPIIVDDCQSNNIYFSDNCYFI